MNKKTINIIIIFLVVIAAIFVLRVQLLELFTKQETYEDILISLISTGIVAMGALFVVKQTLYERVDRTVEADLICDKIKNALEGARSSLTTTQANIFKELNDPNISPAVGNWMNQSIDDVRTSVDTAMSEIDGLKNRLITIKNIGEE